MKFDSKYNIFLQENVFEIIVCEMSVIDIMVSNSISKMGVCTVFLCESKLDIDGVVQERRNSTANALELRPFYTNPSI